MKRSGFALLLMFVLTAALAAQQAAPAPEIARTNLKARVTAPTENDMYCSGFISAAPIAKTSYVAGAWDSPFQTLYSTNDHIYLTGGSYEKGQTLSVLRPVKNVTRYEIVKGEFAAARAAGTPYQEVGRATVVDVRGAVAVAKVEFSCDAIFPGDITTSFSSRETPQYRREVPFDLWAVPNGRTTGKILMGKDFDVLAGDKSNKIYLNVGSNQGVKAGDYFRVTRTYDSLYKDTSSGMPYKASVLEPTRKDPQKFPKARVGEFPRKSIAELMVLYTTPTTATALVTRSWEGVQVGDGVEMMDELPPLPPEPEPVMNKPTITCAVTPATIRVGETAAVRCNADSPDGRPLSFTWSADNGAVNSRNDVATLDARNARPGAANITTTVSDDRNLTASAMTRVGIERAPVAQASPAGDIAFKNNSAYVDNRAKAVLDGIALRLQQNAGSSVMLVGHVNEGESARLASARANNARSYLATDKGIDTGRLQTADAGLGGRKADLWFVPAGAPLPKITPVAAPPAKVVPAKPMAKPAAKPAAKAPAPTTVPKPKPKS
ncbi:MAG: hypothetical protein HYX26_02215 [Acidobacteriales bacterium]|nr:hypothetical protein [Terriglobales bacterium]